MTTPNFSVARPAATLDPIDLSVMTLEPYETYERLRELGPAVWVPAVSRFLVTSYDACRSAEADQVTFTSELQNATLDRALGGVSMIRKNDPQHSADRAPMGSVLRPKLIREKWTSIFERNARTYLAALVERGPDEADLNDDYAEPVSAQNIADMFGLPGVSYVDIVRWSHAFIAGAANILDDPEIWARCATAASEVGTLLDELIPYYRRNPDGSVTSALANSSLPDDSIHTNIKLAISGGLNEPQHMITGSVWALSRHPDQRAQALADPSLWSAVFDEAARWMTPIGMLTRETTKATTLTGVELPAGANLGLVIAAANRDPTVFERPASFDIGRPKKTHLAFGSGVHLCAGAWAARVSVGEVAVPLLYRELPGLRSDPRRPAEWKGWVGRGLTSLPVTW